MRLRLRSYYPLENKIYVSVLEADLIPLHNGRTDERQGTYSAYRGKSGLNLLGLSESVEVPLLFLPRNGMPAFHMISRMQFLRTGYYIHISPKKGHYFSFWNGRLPIRIRP